MKLITILALVFAPAAIAAGAAQARTATTHVGVTAAKPSEFGFKLTTKTVKRGTVVFAIKNASKALVHDFKVCSKPRTNAKPNTCAGKDSKKIGPGKSTTLTFVFKKKGKYEYLCTIPGHAAGGMKGLLTVK